MNKRKSNFELLRIIAILMIIMHHIINHCVAQQCSGADNIFQQAFTSPKFYPELFVIDYGNMLGTVANGIFILISGFFMVEKNNIDLVKVAKKLLLQLVFVTVVLMIGSLAWFIYGNTNNNIVGLIDVFYFNNRGWFLGYYFAIILLGYLFLNRYLMNIEKKNYQIILVGLFVLFSATWTGTMLENLATGLRTLVAGVFLYLMGGYMKKYNPFQKVRLITFVISLIIIFVLVGITSYNHRALDIEMYIANPDKPEYYPLGFYEFYNYSGIVVVTAIIVCEIFRRVKIGSNIIINYIASSTFMIYLMHDNIFFIDYWKTMDWSNILLNDSLGFIIMLLKWTLITFLIGFVVYVLYCLLELIVDKTKFVFIKE